MRLVARTRDRARGGKALGRRVGPPAAWCEALESRVALAGTPFPDISQMVDPDNTVVRYEFRVANQVFDVDVELFDTAGPNGAPGAPRTVANFLKYLRSGRYDETFLHRSANDELFPNLDFVVQGGGFIYDDDTGLAEVMEDAPVANEFDAGRSNIERTIAMAQRGGDPNSATSQFYFNMFDNSFLDDQNFVVFGRVVTDGGWDVVRAIAALDTFHYADADPVTGVPIPGGNELSLALNEVPIVGTPPPPTPPQNLPSSRLREANLVRIANIEVVKASNDRAFMTTELMFPEGYRNTTTIVETLHLVNTAPNNSASYQVIARYAQDGRDVVIATGTLSGNEHREIRISNFNNQNIDLVRKFKPYGLVVQASRPIGASLNHSDFGATASESFINVGELRELGADVLKTWDIGGPGVVGENPVDPNITRRPFVLFMNATPFEATVSVTFARPGGNALTVQRVLGPYRRAGVDVAQTLGVNVISSIRVTSNRDIVASITMYEDRGPPPEGANAYMAAGVPEGTFKGAIPMARYDASRESYITAVNGNPSPAVVWLSFIRSDGTVVDRRWEIPASRRATFNLRDSGIAPGQNFTVAYASSQPLVAQYVSVLGTEVTSTPFSSTGSTVLALTNGALRPSAVNMVETISVWNPYRSTDIEVRLVVSFQFSGPENNRIDLPTGTFVLDAWERVDINPRDFPSVITKIQSGQEFDDYSIVVRAVGKRLSNQQTFNAAVVAQLTRWRPGNSRAAVTTLATPNNETFFLHEARYNR